MDYVWYGKVHEVDPSMVHIFIEAVVVDLNTDDASGEIDYTFEILMHIRGKKSDS